MWLNEALLEDIQFTHIESNLCHQEIWGFWYIMVQKFWVDGLWSKKNSLKRIFGTMPGKGYWSIAGVSTCYTSQDPTAGTQKWWVWCRWVSFWVKILQVQNPLRFRKENTLLKPNISPLLKVFLRSMIFPTSLSVGYDSSFPGGYWDWGKSKFDDALASFWHFDVKHQGLLSSRRAERAFQWSGCSVLNRLLMAK